MSGRCATTGQVQRCDDAREDPQVDLAACERLGALSLVCVPLTRGARTVAVVKVYSSALAAFEDDDVVALRLVAVSGAAALDRAEASAALARSEEWFRTVFAASPVAMLVTSADGEVLDGNDAASRLLERVDDPPVGISLATLAADGDDAQLHADLSALRAGGGVVRGERRFRAASGRVVWTHMAATAVDAVGNGRVVVQLEDIGERKRAEERLTALASTDALTGLPNRASLLRTVAAALTGGRDADARGVAVLFVDLDGFKAVNDGAGHDAGDAVLRKVARRLSHAVRPGDVVGRLGGDEFLVVCEAVTPAAAHTVAQRVERAAAEPVLVGGVAHRLGASVGVVVVEPGDRCNAADVVRAADAAMYRRKSHRRSTHRGVAATPQASRRVPHRVD